MSEYVIYPGVDEQYNFPPEVRQRIAESLEVDGKIKEELVDYRKVDASNNFEAPVRKAMAESTEVNGVIEGKIKNRPIVDTDGKFVDPEVRQEIANSSEIGQKVNDRIAERAVPINVLSNLAYVAASDFTTDLQAKIDTLATNGGGIIELTRGDTGLLNTSIKLKAGVSIRGRGKTASEINLSGNFPAFVSATPATRIDNVELSDFRIYRIVPSAASTPIIDWTGIAHSEIHNLSLDQPTVSRHSTSGILFGENSYYNKVDMVQIRGVNEGMRWQNEANGSNITNCTVLTSNYGYVVDFTNSLALIGCAAEHVDQVGFLIRNKSKKNRIIASRAEDIPTCFQVLGGANPAFDNFLLGNLAYERAGGVRYDLQTSNVVLQENSAAGLLPYTSHTFIHAYKNTAQAALSATSWTKVLLQTELEDQTNEFTNSTFTATRPGLYQFQGAVEWVGVASTKVELALYVNGSIARMIDSEWASNPSAMSLMGTATLKLNANDTVELWAKTSVSQGIGSGVDATYFTATRLV